MLYKFIDIPQLEEIQRHFLKEVPRWPSSDHRNFPKDSEYLAGCTPLIEYLEKVNLWRYVKYIGILQIYPHVSPIHVDRDEENTPYAINIPVYNYIDTHVAFYEVVSGETSIAKTTEDTQWTDYSTAEMKEIDRIYYHKAAIFNTQVPHQVCNYTDDVRISVSIRFTKSLIDIIDFDSL